MQSNYLLALAIITGIAFLFKGAVLFLVLSRGRQKHHYLFAAVLALFAVGSLSMFLFVIRNSHLDELIIYVSVNTPTLLLSIPCIYHFTCSYLNQPRKKSIIFIWIYTAICVIFSSTSRLQGK